MMIEMQCSVFTSSKYEILHSEIPLQLDLAYIIIMIRPTLNFFMDLFSVILWIKKEENNVLLELYKHQEFFKTLTTTP